MTLAVWRRDCDEATLTLDLSEYLEGEAVVEMTYPQNPMGAEFSYNGDTCALTVRLPKRNSARFFEIEVK